MRTAVQIKSIDVTEEIEACKMADSSPGESVFVLFRFGILFSHNSMILGSVVAISHLFSHNSMILGTVVAIAHPFSHNSMILDTVVAIGEAGNKISPSHTFIKDNIIRI